MLIGITGGSGSGKSIVAEEIRNNNIPVIDADIVAREVTQKGSPALSEIADSFGREYLSKDGSLLRKKLGSLVFSDSDKLNELNRIISQYISLKIDEEIKKANAPIICIDAPLLIEYGLNKECDAVISVIADRNIRIDRIIRRDNLSVTDATNRINSQHDDNFYLEKSDYVLYNNSTKEALIAETKKIINQLRENL